MPPMLIGAAISAAGSIAGGVAGKEAGAGARGDANNKRNDALEMIQSLKDAPESARPLLLEKYRQAGILTPELEQQINQNVSKVSEITTQGQGKDAQLQALKQLSETSKGGMTGADRAALNQARQQSQSAEEGKRQQIMQQFAARGQGGMGAELAAQLAGSQQSSNEQAAASDRLAQMAQQNALQATSQLGGLGTNVEGQQFGEANTKAQAQDEMNRFNITNQLSQQQRNVGSKNQAQASNLANLQAINNTNVGQGNQELQRQRQGEQTDYINKLNLAQRKADSLSGRATSLQAEGDAAAKGQQDLYSGIGNAIHGGIGEMQNQSNLEKGLLKPGKYDGGQIDYRNGGHVNGEEVVPGDDPRNDTVDAKLSPGEIVIPKTLAQTSLGDKLLDLLKHHHEIKTHLDGIEKKANKPQKQKKIPQYKDGGEVPQSNIEKFIGSLKQKLDPQPPQTKHIDTEEERLEKIRQQAHEDFMNPSYGAPKKSFSDGGMIPERGTPQYLQHLMDQLHGKKSYYDGTGLEDSGVVPEQYPEPEIDPLLSQQESQQPEMQLPPAIKEESNPEDSMDKEELKPSRNEPTDKDFEDIISGGSKEEPNDTEPDSDIDDKSSDGEMESDLRSELPTEKSSRQFDSSSDALRQAQNERLQNSYSRQIQEGAALAGSGISRTDPTKIIEMIRQQKDRMDLPVKSFGEQVANKPNDPNSEMSKATRDAYKQITGKDANPDWSASDIKNAFPLVEKYIQAKEASKTKKEIAEDKLKSTEEEKKKDRELKLMQIQAGMQSHRDTLATTANRIDVMHFDRNTSKFQNWQKSLMADPLIKDMTKNTIQADRMFKSNGVPNLTPEEVEKLNPKDLNKRYRVQVVEDAIQMNKLLTDSNIMAASTLDKLVPRNLNMSTAQFLEFFQNKPKEANNGEYIKAYLKIAANIKQLYQQEIKKRREVYAQGATAFADTHMNEIQSTLPLVGLDSGFININQPQGYEKYKNKKSGKESNTAPNTNSSIIDQSQKTDSNMDKQIKTFSEDVSKYAKDHNITEEQAQAIKDKRTGH